MLATDMRASFAALIANSINQRQARLNEKHRAFAIAV
jgi:hypothetical protein